MKSRKFFLATILAVAVSLSALLTLSTVDQAYAVKRIYDAILSGQNEVPPVQSSASGKAEFTDIFNDTMTYRINITGISGATGAHIHAGQDGENGEVVVELMTDTTKNRDTSYGMTIRGNLSDSSLKGPMQGQTLEDLVAAINSGETYVNIHTAQNPDGEIRGQLINTEQAESTEQEESTNSSVGFSTLTE